MESEIAVGQREVKLEDIWNKTPSAVYAQEYRAIHQQRTSLVNIIHRWHAIGLPIAIAIFGIFVREAIVLETKIETEKLNELLLIIGTILAQGIIVFVRYYAEKIDLSVIQLYPRIMFLELLLDYHFYRYYLSTNGNEAKRFVKRCEDIQADTTNSLWEGVLKNFKLKDFPAAKRGHGVLNWTGCTMIGVFGVITIVLIFLIEKQDESAFLVEYTAVTIIFSVTFILLILNKIKLGSARQ